MQLETLLAEAVERKASDLHLSAGQPPIFRIASALVKRDATPALDAADIEELILPALTDMGHAALAEGGASSAEATLALPGAEDMSFSLLALRAQGGLTATVRLISNKIPTLEQICDMSGGGGSSEGGRENLALLTEIANLRRGLVVITGPTGSGKLTTAAAIIEQVNLTRAERIFVLEEAPGYAFTGKESVVTTLRIGQDFESYERAGYSLMRGADPDIVLFSDLPTQAAARQALVMADTGHLVIAVLAAEGAAQAAADLVGAFPEPRDNIRSLMARNLAVVVNQRLIVRPSGRGRVAAYEWLRATAATRSLLQQGATSAELEAAMTVSDGHRSLDAALDKLVASEAITQEQAGLNRRR